MNRSTFPDLRIEHEEPDGRWDHEDIEVTTIQYTRGAHAAAVARLGFTCYGVFSARVGGGSRGRSADPRLAQESW